MILTYLIPALGWGLMPIVAAKTKSKPVNQLLGTAVVAFVFGGIVYLFFQPELTVTGIFLTYFSGVFWAVGQYLQFAVLQLLTVSEAMPISNGTQLIGTTLMAVVFFDEWAKKSSYFFGILGMILIILGILFTSYTEKNKRKIAKNYARAVILLLISSSSLTMYVTLPKFVELSGKAAIFPQAIGIICASMAISWINRKQFDKGQVLSNLSTGVCWSIANISLFLLIPIIGVAKSFTISQFAVLISIYGGIFFLKVSKTKNEKKKIFLGALLIILGILLIGSIKS